MVDYIIARHASIYPIILMHDYFPELPIALEKLGSDCSKDYFSLLSQHVWNKYNFYVAKVAQRTSCIGRVEKIKQEKDSILFPNPRRCKNLWWEGNPNKL